ncbi:MAG: 4-hydroxy-tetrahydrodipicolinate synthase [Bacilli bacterium]|jgi:4-hydroxy-tetrahydrodipicolinate synthase
MKIRGSYVALVTPMYEDGSINFDEFERLIEYHIEKKTDGLVILGTTGESATLTHEEDEKIVEFVVKHVNKRIPVIAGSGSNNSEVAKVQSQKFEKLGVDGLLVISPYYNKTNRQGMLDHFLIVADNVNIPVILYNVPGRTGCNIDVDVVGELSKHKNIVGIKEASGNISYIAKIAKYVNDDFCLLSGNDDMIVPVLSMGGVGVISVAANILPNEMHELVMNYLNGKTKEALSIQLKYLDLINTLFIETNPIPIKEAMNYLGFNVGGYRLPLTYMDKKNKETLIKSLSILGGKK